MFEQKNIIETIPSLNNNINLELHSHFLPHSASFRKDTIKILEEIQKNTEQIICIDWSAFSTNIESFDDKNIKNADILLQAWIDWIIHSWKKNVKLILPVADCAAISVIHKSGKIHWLFHGWYKWVAWNIGDLWIIINIINNLRETSNSNSLKDFDFYISPMMWLDFELPKEYVNTLFCYLFKEYNLDSLKYLKKHKYNSEKIYLNLKQLIKDLLKIEWVNLRKQVSFSRKITNSKNSHLPSYRLHSQAKDLRYKIDYRLALIQKTY